MTTPRVGLVIVSHSKKLAEGVAELAGQMAPEVPIIPAGGTSEGGLGTDYEAVIEAITAADHGAGVVLLFDLGSAQMTADMAVENLDDPAQATVADAPLVEGAVAAAVAAAGGQNQAAVAAAAESRTVADDARTPDAQTEITLTNEVGLHARPAALLARAVANLDATVTIHKNDQQADAASVLALLSLTARKGDRLTVTAQGPQAPEAITRIQQLSENNFNE